MATAKLKRTHKARTQPTRELAFAMSVSAGWLDVNFRTRARKAASAIADTYQGASPFLAGVKHIPSEFLSRKQVMAVFAMAAGKGWKVPTL